MTFSIAYHVYGDLQITVFSFCLYVMRRPMRFFFILKGVFITFSMIDLQVNLFYFQKKKKEKFSPVSSFSSLIKFSTRHTRIGLRSSQWHIQHGGNIQHINKGNIRPDRKQEVNVLEVTVTAFLWVTEVNYASQRYSRSRVIAQVIRLGKKLLCQNIRKPIKEQVMTEELTWEGGCSYSKRARAGGAWRK